MNLEFPRHPDVRWTDAPTSTSEVYDRLVRLQRQLQTITTEAAANSGRILQVAAFHGTDTFLAAETFVAEQGHELGSALRQVEELMLWAGGADDVGHADPGRTPPGAMRPD